MPLTPEEHDWISRYASGAPRDELRQQIPMMYGDPTTDEMGAALAGMPPGATAQNMSVEPTMSSAGGAGGLQSTPMPAPPPMSSDAGGMSMPPPQPTLTSEAPAMSTISPEALRAEAARGASTPTEPTVSEAGGMAAPQQSPEDAAYQRYLLGSGRGGGHMIPGGEQLASRKIARDIGAPLSPEAAADIETAKENAALGAITSGGAQANIYEQQAEQHRQQAQDIRAQAAQYTRDTAAKRSEYETRQSELDDMRADIQKNPATYWSGKGTGEKILNVIGLVMLGLGGEHGGGQLIQPIINAEIERKQKERGQAISLLQDRLNRFREGIPSPEAQANYERSLALDAVASEAENLASQAKAVDVRQRGYDFANKARMDAAIARANAETAMKVHEEIETKNMPAKYVGGGKSYEEQIIERGKKAGDKSGRESLAFAVSGRAPEGKNMTSDEIAMAKHERELFVRLPDGSGAYATTGAQKKELQDRLDKNDELLKAYAHLEELHKQMGPSGQWNREAAGDAETTVSRIQDLLREPGIKFNESTMKMLAPQSGEGIKDWIIGPKLPAAINRAKNIREAETQRVRSELSASPWRDEPITTPVGGKGSTFKAEE